MSGLKQRPLAAHRCRSLRGANGSGPKRSNPAPAHKNWIASLALAMTKQMLSRGAPRPSFASRRTKNPGPIPSDGRRRWYRLHLDRARLTKIRKAKRRQTRNLPSASTDAAARLISLPSAACGEGREGRARLSAFHRGACGSEPTPPLSSSTRFLGRGRYQALLEAGLSQSSELLADRSWCRPGVFPEPPGDGSDEPPPAGTALAPAAGVTRRPSCTRARFVTSVSAIGTTRQ
jgi:hypothetical protein